MNLYKQPNGWSCFPTALAMCVGIKPDKILEMIGHDGSEKLWAGLKSPECRRAFHPGELNLVAYKLGFSITVFETRRVMAGPNGLTYTLPRFNLKDLLSKESGILTSTNPAHAVAWDHIEKHIHDPNYTIYGLDKFDIEDFYMVRKL